MPTVLALMAHPDDIEITCAGTLALLARAGWTVHCATMTAGDLGSAVHPRGVISRIRRREARAAAAVIGAAYTCLGFDDFTIVCDGPSKRRVSGLLREVTPDVLVTPAPVDYMADHEETARVAREAAFGSTIPNWRAFSVRGRSRRPLPPCEALPVVLTADPLDLVDHDGRRTRPELVVDITAVIDVKEQMLAAHASQREWLRAQHGEDEYLLWMRRVARDRARDARRRAVEYAEGFRVHRGHGFPARDVLTEALGPRVVRRLAPVPRG
jgi:LmbE family N-acetylglucosaminyl deacetylase